jgi:vancomycin resistance protein YoaR
LKKFSIIICLLILSFVLLQNRAEAIAPRLTLSYQEQTFSVSQEQVNAWQLSQTINSSKVLSPSPVEFSAAILNYVGQKVTVSPPVKYYNYNLGMIYDFVKTTAEKINVKVQEPELEIKDEKVIKFIPPTEGLSVDIFKTAFDTLTALQVDRNSVQISVNQTLPENSLSQTNSLGINELIAHGVSKFNGSPYNRRHNIAVGTEKFKGIIIKPGEEFSFNKFLGPVEASEGFLPELVIKGDKGTIPELGGGLCQVSSTTFRAAMEAGLPITQRRNHAYAVQYYAPQGTDATIYPGVIDLKFINDTPGAILIWPYQKDKDTLVFDFYGTKDTRQVTLHTPIQYDKKPNGSMKAIWTRDVIGADGTTKTDEFKSTYQSPALFHKTEEFVSAPVDPLKGLQMPKNN